MYNLIIFILYFLKSMVSWKEALCSVETAVTSKVQIVSLIYFSLMLPSPLYH